MCVTWTKVEWFFRTINRTSSTTALKELRDKTTLNCFTGCWTELEDFP